MPRKPGSKARPKSSRRMKVSKPIKTYVKRMLSRNVEEKFWSSSAQNIDITTVGGSTPTNLYLLPTPTNGSGYSDRIGEEIMVKRASVRGFVNLSKYDSLANNTTITPIWVKIWIVSSKLANSNTFSNLQSSSAFFRSNNDSLGFNGTLRDQTFPVNQDLFTVHKTKMFKLGASNASAQLNTTGYYDNSPMSVPFTFDLTKYVNKLQFDEAQTWPTNKNLFMVITATPCDGSQVPQSSSRPLAEYHYHFEHQYHDA